LEREWRQSVTDATAVFSRIDRDLSALGGRVGLDEHRMKEFKTMLDSFETDYSRFLFRLHALEESKKEFAERIESLEMSLAFAESNAGVDATRIQQLEEQFDDLSNKVEHMQSKLCTCGGKVRVFLL